MCLHVLSHTDAPLLSLCPQLKPLQLSELNFFFLCCSRYTREMKAVRNKVDDTRCDRLVCMTYFRLLFSFCQLLKRPYADHPLGFTTCGWSGGAGAILTISCWCNQHWYRGAFTSPAGCVWPWTGGSCTRRTGRTPTAPPPPLKDKDKKNKTIINQAPQYFYSLTVFKGPVREM